MPESSGAGKALVCRGMIMPDKSKPPKINDQGATNQAVKPTTSKPERPQAKSTGTGDFFKK